MAESNENVGEQHKLKVRKVYAQMIFTTEHDRPKMGRDSGDFVMIDFQEAMDGMRLYCADLTDYVRVGDSVTAQNIEKDEDDNFYGRGVKFDFNPSSRFTSIDESNADYITGTGIVQHVGGVFAGIRSTDPSVSQPFKELLMPITALTKDSIPIGKQVADVQLGDLIHTGDTISYKVTRSQTDEGPRESRKVASARKCSIEGQSNSQ